MKKEKNVTPLRQLLTTAIKEVNFAKADGDEWRVQHVVDEALVPFAIELQAAPTESLQCLLERPDFAHDLENFPLLAGLLLESASKNALHYRRKLAYQRYYLGYLLLSYHAEHVPPTLERRHQLMLLHELLQLPKAQRYAS